MTIEDKFFVLLLTHHVNGNSDVRSWYIASLDLQLGQIEPKYSIALDYPPARLHQLLAPSPRVEMRLLTQAGRHGPPLHGSDHKALLLLADDLPCPGVLGPEEQWLLRVLWQRGLREALCGECLRGTGGGISPQTRSRGTASLCQALRGWVTSPRRHSGGSCSRDHDGILGGAK